MTVETQAYRPLPWIDHDGVRVLEIKGRISGIWRATPVRVLEFDGHQYLVAPQGQTQWVRNLRVQRRGRLRLGGRVTEFEAEELADEAKAPVLRAYFRRWWSQTASLTSLTAPDAPEAEVTRAAPLHPTFRVIVAGAQ
jgi:deazaflavin-dependent oxidoreductase (nitroreductase family)